MSKVLMEGYRITKDGGGLWTGVVGGSLRDGNRTDDPSGQEKPPQPPRGFSAIKPAKIQPKE